MRRGARTTREARRCTVGCFGTMLNSLSCCCGAQYAWTAKLGPYRRSQTNPGGEAGIPQLKCSNPECTSPPYWTTTSKRRGKMDEANRACVFAMRSIGQGQRAAAKFSTAMNMPPPVLPRHFRAHGKKVKVAAQQATMDSMARAAEAVRILAAESDEVAASPPDDEISDCGVTI